MQLLTSFEGRILRSGWWTGVLVVILAGLVGGFVIRQGLGEGGAAAFAQTALSLVLFYPYAAVSTKRLHDRGKPAMPWLAIFLVPALLLQLMRHYGIGFSEQAIAVEAERVSSVVAIVPDPLGWVVTLVALVTGLWGVVEMGLSRGVQTDNAYGPVPQG